MSGLLPGEALHRRCLQPFMNDDLHLVARVIDLPPGSRRVVTVNGVAVGRFHLANGNGFRAYVDFCPHAGAPLCGSGPLATGPDGRPVLRCPWHGWEFDLDTGVHVKNARCRLDALPVEVDEGGNVRVRA